MEELKKCPFCGEEAELKSNYGYYGYFVTVECEFCGAQTKGFSAGIKNENKEKAFKRAKAAWNRRTQEQNE